MNTRFGNCVDVIDRNSAGRLKVCGRIAFALINVDSSLQIFNIKIVQQHSIGAGRKRFAKFSD